MRHGDCKDITLFSVITMLVETYSIRLFTSTPYMPVTAQNCSSDAWANCSSKRSGFFKQSIYNPVHVRQSLQAPLVRLSQGDIIEYYETTSTLIEYTVELFVKNEL
mmetsp:Transcript_10959/g.33623  ORF Transcript_10959/g.33623 Transcript_10959/m.33623 type:complete len:106 (+) Transcript_10959:1081-1398(+)